jgi:thioesterase domain-containing protein
MHCEQLRAIMPEGPYLLAGWSFGGVMAFEMAQQIHADGQRVEFLGLIDANPVRDPITGRKISDSPHLNLINHALEEIDRGLAIAEPPNMGHLFADPTWIGMLGENFLPNVPASHLRKNLLLARENMRAAIRYRAAPYAGPIDVFQAMDSTSEIRELLATDMEALAKGPLRIHSVPGDHSSMLRPPLVETTARVIDHFLEAI